VTRIPLSRSKKVKGQGHQTALLSAALTRKAAAAGSMGTYWACERIGRGKVLLRCVSSAAREALGRPRGKERGGAYCVATRTACAVRPWNAGTVSKRTDTPSHFLTFRYGTDFRFSSDADNVRLTNVCIIIIIILVFRALSPLQNSKGTPTAGA